MNSKLQIPTRATRLAAMAAALAVCGVVQAQENTVKVAVTRISNHSSTNGVSGVGVPAGADAVAQDATAVTFTVERMLTPNIGAELVLGIPPRVRADAAGSVAYLGKDVLSAETVAPTAFVNYHFGVTGDTWRPFIGVGVNYTRFIKVRSILAPNPTLGDSYGLAAQVGVDYAIGPNWGVFASVARLDVKSKLVAAGTTVVQTTIDFKPVTYTAGLLYKF